MVVLNGTKPSEAVLPYIRELTKHMPAEVFLLRVVSPVLKVRMDRGLENVKLTEQQIESTRVSARSYLESLGNNLADTMATLHYEVRVGDLVTEAADIINKKGIRLIALTTRRYLAIRQLIAGSTTRRILHAASVPVLLVKAPD